MRLNFNGKGLSETPEVVFEIDNLIELSMYNNKINNDIQEIPSSVMDLECLEKLDQRWNKNLKFTQCLDDIEKKGCVVYK